jgi:CubicO group peptidase (beta-lactamase class C family)
VTWRHLLQQTSEWEGELFDKPDRIDRNRHVGPGVGARPKGSHRDLGSPGTHWEYNDVRVNRLALSLLQVFRRPLPEVLREAVMDPIGASETWVWRGYRNSTNLIGETPMESVSGGSHWGGGLAISTEDHARVGLLLARGGAWGDRRLIAPYWITALAEPCPPNRSYGLMWWVNTDRVLYPSAPATSLFALGMGLNLIWVDATYDLVVVARWIRREAADGFMARVMAAVTT